MAQTGLGSLSQAQVFRCRNCQEVINTGMSNCAYCGVAIDHAAAQAAADAQAYVANAYSDASYAKIAARALVVFFLLGLIPLFPGWPTLILLIVVPVLVVRWWIKYRGLQTTDPDYEKARRHTIIAAVIWSAVLVGWFVISVTVQLVSQ
jgi:hypothetical protein